ncbi:hypothetical protein QJS66_14115 [Kocuria rhizophila]|nr:hypothetical protein QJS66_14115 [Kocuria rhizophila]
MSELVGAAAPVLPEHQPVRARGPWPTRVVADASSTTRRSRLWLESTLRKSLSISEPRPALTCSRAGGYADLARGGGEALEPGRRTGYFTRMPWALGKAWRSA